MNVHANALVLKPEYFQPSVTSLRRWLGLVDDVAAVPVAAPAPRPATLSRSVRLVALLAFGQSVLFLALWLFVCAATGAAEPAADAVDEGPKLRPSLYEPQTERDPFRDADVAAAGGATVAPRVPAAAFKLQGILFHPTKPAAMVNGKLLELNKPVLLETNLGKVQATAIAIVRELVTLRIGEETVELSMLPPARAPVARETVAAPVEPGGVVAP